jgi:cellulose synthase (UDP-forming)
MKVTSPAVENEPVFQWWDYPLFLTLSVLCVSAIFYFTGHWISLEDRLYHPLFFWALTLVLLIVLLNNQGKWYGLLSMRRPRAIEIQTHWRVAVATTIVPGPESVEMLEPTLKALVALDYPHDTWVLDEADDERVKALCQKTGAYHFSRKKLPGYRTETGVFQQQSKHGNYNAWLHELAFGRYDVITAFDPDHVPASSFLRSVLCHFEDPKIGYVQAAQAYYNQGASFIACGAAEETYSYYSCIQMAAYGMGYPISIGSHNTHRVAALKEVGGFAAHDADDLLITLSYRSQGWQGVYVPQILARGLTPVDWSGYLTQQRRWARSVLDIKLRHAPRMSSNLPLLPRAISLLHGLNYLHRSFIIPMVLVAIAFTVAGGAAPKAFSVPTLGKFAMLWVALQLCEFYRQRFYLDWRSEWGLHWRAGILQLAKWPYLLSALWDVIGRKRWPYVLTPKIGSRSGDGMLLWPNGAVMALMGIAWAVGVTRDGALPLSLHVVTGVIMVAALLLGLSEFFKFPDAYDRALLVKFLRSK